MILRRAQHADLVNRISVRYQLRPFSREQTGRYIDFQLSGAAGDPQLFDDSVKAAIHDFTGGVPRRINNLATACLLEAAVHQVRRIDDELFQQAVGEFQLQSHRLHDGRPGLRLRHRGGLSEVSPATPAARPEISLILLHSHRQTGGTFAARSLPPPPRSPIPRKHFTQLLAAQIKTIPASKSGVPQIRKTRVSLGKTRVFWGFRQGVAEGT